MTDFTAFSSINICQICFSIFTSVIFLLLLQTHFTHARCCDQRTNICTNYAHCSKRIDLFCCRWIWNSNKYSKIVILNRSCRYLSSLIGAARASDPAYSSRPSTQRSILLSYDMTSFCGGANSHTSVVMISIDSVLSSFVFSFPRNSISHTRFLTRISSTATRIIRNANFFYPLHQ